MAAKKEEEVKPVKIAPVEETGVAEVTEAAPPAVVGPSELGAATGEIGASDIQFPTLKIIQKMSDNPDKLDEGTIALDNSLIIQNEQGEARMTILTYHKYFKEVLPFGAGIPRTFESSEEAMAEGFTVARSKQDRESGRPLVEDAARAIVLIEKPENALDRSFPYEFDGVRYTPAIWWIQSTAYRNVGKFISTKLQFELKGTGLLPAVFRLKTEAVKGTQGTYYVPRMALLNEERSAKFIEQVKEQIKL